MSESAKRIALAALAGCCFGTLTLLAADPPPAALTPPATWAALAILGSAAMNGLTIIGFYFATKRHRREEEADFEAKVRRVAREFTETPEYRKATDQRIREVSGAEIDESFAERAGSFVSSERYDERNAAINERFASHEETVKEINRKIDALPGLIRSELTFLMSGRIVMKDHTTDAKR